MKSFAVSSGFQERLLQGLRRRRRIFGPVVGPDGVCRLRPVAAWTELSLGALPLIPLKKFLLPPKDELWSWEDREYRLPSSPPHVALVGIPPCDLYGLAYLDLSFAGDPLYEMRRRQLFLVGTACEPGPLCFCPPRTEPPPFDLFLAPDRVWSATERGDDLLTTLAEDLGGMEEELDLPEAVTGGVAAGPPADLERIFLAAANQRLWREVGERCVSCGACSAVCPTCYCYDVVDEATPGGAVKRVREWDNCFFRSHALVAGGHNFRPTRTERLRFRFEHKLLGFGALRGISSCVGCGRCGRACPVDIDISEVLSRLAAEETP